MSLQNLRPMLWTEDLTGSVDFYTAVLRFTANEINNDWGWAWLSKDNVHLMLARPNEHTPYDKIGFTGSFYFTNVKAAGVSWPFVPGATGDQVLYSISVNIKCPHRFVGFC